MHVGAGQARSHKGFVSNPQNGYINILKQYF